MAETTNGIYYPTDGTQPADVLADMKKMAESMEEAIINNKFDPKEINDDITKIQEEQTMQNKAIEDNAAAIEQNTTDITKLQEDNAKLKAQIPKGTAAGEEISLRDSAEMELVDFSLQGNSYQETAEDYNLLPTAELFPTTIINGITFTLNDDGTITVNGTATENAFYAKDISLPAGTYRISGCPENGGQDKYALQVLSYVNDFGEGDNFTLEQESTIKIRVMVWSGITVNNLIYKLMIVAGTEVKEFAPYGGMPSLGYSSEVQAVGDSGSVEIKKTNKNWLPYDLFPTTTINGVTFTNNPDGTIKANGTATANAFYRQDVTLQAGDYLLTGSPADAENSKYGIQAMGYGIGDFGEGQSFSLSKETAVPIRLMVWQGVTVNNIIFKPMIESGNSKTEFIKHEGNTYTIPIQKPFYKSGDYKDSFIRQNNKRYEQHYIKEYIFTGNENWFDGGTTTNNQYIWSNPFEDANKSILGNYNDDIVSPVLSNYFISIGNRPNNAGSVGISFVNFTNGETHLRVGVGLNSEYNTLELFKQKLQELNAAGTPVKMYYILATPELIECTSEQTQVLEQIVKDGTYKEVTHFYTTEDLKPTIEVKYYKDLETLFKNQAEIQNTLNNVQAQILELGGN